MKKIYLIKCENESVYKIGYSKNPQLRIKQLQTGSDKILKLISQFDTKFPCTLETALHRRFSYLRKNGEWFKDLPELFINNFEKECQKVENNLAYLNENSNLIVIR
jgi:hypothetical protein